MAAPSNGKSGAPNDLPLNREDMEDMCRTLKKIKKRTMDLWKADEFCDVTLTAGNISIKAHKIVLASHSEYFRALFCGNFSDAKKDLIRIGN